MRFDDFFAKIPFLPSIEVCKHLKPAHLIYLSTFSDQWKLAVECSPIREVKRKPVVKIDWDNLDPAEFALLPIEDQWKLAAESCPYQERSPEVDITIIENTLKIGLKFERNETNNFQFSSTPEHFFGNEEITAEKTIGMLRLITRMFPPYYEGIKVSIGSGSSAFPFKLLSILPRGEIYQAFAVSIEGEKPAENCDDLIKFLETICWVESLTLKIPFKSDQLKKINRIDANEIIIEDARFIAGSALSLMKKCSNAHFGPNNFTSQDINGLLREWKRGDYCLDSLVVEISDNQMIDMDEVTRDLNAVDWDAAIRNRYYVYYTDGNNTEISYPTYHPVFIDLANGKDFQHDGEFPYYGTVCLLDGKLIFRGWGEACWPETSYQFHTGNLEFFLRELEESKKEKERLEEMMEGNEERMKKVLEDIETNSEIVETAIQTLRTIEPYLQN